MQLFAVAQANDYARRSLDFQADNAGKILAEVENVNTVRRRSDGRRFDLLNRAHWQSRKGFELGRTFEAKIDRTSFDFHRIAGLFAVGKLVKCRRHAAVFGGQNRGVPFRIVKIWLRPSDRFLARVVRFTHQKIAFADWSVA